MIMIALSSAAVAHLPVVYHSNKHNKLIIWKMILVIVVVVVVVVVTISVNPTLIQ